MEKGTTGVASQHIAASPEAIYDLVSDITRMGDWSPECVGGEWLDGATGPAVGARFRGKNRQGKARWSTKPRVVTAERGREFAFVVPDPLGHDSARWSYRFEASGSGTEVTESFEVLQDSPFYVRIAYRLGMGLRDRKANLDANLQNTLLALKSAAESKKV
jgi:hypothetical protein